MILNLCDETFFFFSDHGRYFYWETTGLYQRNLCFGRFVVLFFLIFFSFNKVEITFAQLKCRRVQIFALCSRGSERAFFDSVS